MTIQCENCDNHVSDDYVRVFSPDGDAPRCCPHCEDMVRANGKARESRGHRDSRATPDDGGVS